MKNKIILLVLFIITINTYSQGTRLKVYPGISLSEQIDSTIQYVYPEFKVGKVYFKDGTYLLSLLNYNTLLGEMHFFDQGKKLQLGRINEIVTVNFSNRIFKNVDNKLFELIVTGRNEMLMERVGRIIDLGKKVGYGGQSQVSSVTTISSHSFGGSSLSDLPSEETEVLINIDSIYYILADNKVKVINGVRTIKAFNSQYEKQIDDFVKENNTKMQNYSDIKALFKFINSLD